MFTCTYGGSTFSTHAQIGIKSVLWIILQNPLPAPSNPYIINEHSLSLNFIVGGLYQNW